MPVSTKRSVPKRLAIAAAWIVALWILGGFVWYSPGITGRIVDPDGRPVAQAIVLVNWNLEGSWNGASQGQLALIEARTDANGYFRISSWGPRFARKGHLREDQPLVRVFKPGYVPLLASNTDRVPMGTVRFVASSRFDGKTLVLHRFNGPANDYEAVLEPLFIEVDRILYSSPSGTCYWKHMPRLLLSLQDVMQAFPLRELPPPPMLGSGSSYRDVQHFARPKDEHICGNAKIFFDKFK